MSSTLATDWPTTAFDVLASPRRRYALSVLADRQSPISVESLATEVAVREHQSPIVTDDQATNASVELIHRHFPRLLEVGVVAEDDGDDETRRFALDDHPMFEADWVRSLLEQPRGGSAVDEERLDRTLELLRCPRRRTMLQLLARQSGSIAVADLAALYVAETNEGVRLVDLEEDDWKRAAIRLVHVDLPALDDVGIVDYDHSSATVSIETDAPQWRAEWLGTGPLGNVTATFEDRSDPRSDDVDDEATTGECWTIAGREDVIARGHEIADRATEELAVTVPDAGLIQNRCLDRWRAAADRGVDVYVGSRSREVREIVRQAIPEATVCEPQFDWLNFPTDGIDHGRLVFADREHVMLVTIDVADGETDAMAITGTGTENTLVKLVREHVGPRLDRLKRLRVDESDAQQPTELPL